MKNTTDGVKIAWLRDNIVNGMTIVDAGACIGKLTTLFTNLVGKEGRVVAYEPRLGYFKRLEEAVEGQNVLCVNAAVGNYDGEGELHIANKLGWDSMSPKRDFGIGTATVEVLTLDIHLKQIGIDKVDILKIDVEGWDLCVLEGAESIIDSSERIAIILEVHSFHVDRNELLNFLLSRGFTVFNLGSYDIPVTYGMAYHNEILAVRGVWKNEIDRLYAIPPILKII